MRRRAQPGELKDGWARFFFHWGPVTAGCSIREMLPVMERWRDPATPVAYPRWWAVVLTAALASLVGGVINANLPITAREFLKSLGLGFALNAATVLARLR